MSLKCIAASSTSHFGMLPHTSADNTDLPQTSSLRHSPMVVNCLPVLKQNKSDQMKSASKSEKFLPEKLHNLLTVHVDPKGNCSIQKTNQPTVTHLVRVVTAANDIVPVSTNGSSVAVNSNMIASKVSTPCTLGINVVSNVSSPFNSETNGLSEEKSAVVDSTVDSSNSCSEQGSKVIVQKLSAVSCDEVNFLEDMFNINEILEKKTNEKKWSPEKAVSSNGQDVPSASPIEKPKDVCQKENFPSKALLQRKMRKNHEMNLHIRPGNGIKLNDIAYIVNNLKTASSSLLGFLHKVLFGTYGACNNTDSLSQTKQNILHFSGFPFSEDSETFKMKRQCLSKVPYPMLSGICKTLLIPSPRTRNDSVEDILSFLLKPQNNSILDQQLKAKLEADAENELMKMKRHAFNGPTPIVLVPKLDDNLVKELLQKMDHTYHSTLLNNITGIQVDTVPESTAELVKPFTQETVPAVSISNSTLTKKIQLKDFPEVVVRIARARRRIINVLHTLLYGRPGSDDAHRSNILEFSGYTRADENAYKRKMGILQKLRKDELDQLCSILSLQVKDLSIVKKIPKFLHHLRASTLALKSKKLRFAAKGARSGVGRSDMHPFPVPELQTGQVVQSADTGEQCKKTEFQPKYVNIITKKMKTREKCKMVKVDQPIKKLKDIEKIRRNIECASPEDLTELNDLLFLRPCDNFEIHQKILEFSSSSFQVNSADFYSRRTLLHYMNFDTIKKMASLLEITDWEEYKIPQDLANTLLRFLTDMKPSVKVRQRLKPHRFREKVSSSITHQPHLMQMERENSWGNNLDSNLTSTSATNTSTYSKEGFHEERSTEDTSVVVRRISESSYSFTDLRTNDPVTVSNSNSDESLTLFDYIQHPSDKQLEVTIREVLFTNTWSSTMGNLINMVFQCYPKLNLTYRVDFIKAKALEVLHEICNATPSDTVDEKIC